MNQSPNPTETPEVGTKGAVYAVLPPSEYAALAKQAARLNCSPECLASQLLVEALARITIEGRPSSGDLQDELKSPAETGKVIHVHADTIGAELTGIMAITGLLKDALLEREETRKLPAWLNTSREGRLLRAAEALAVSSYNRVAFAVGDESILIDGLSPADEQGGLKS